MLGLVGSRSSQNSRMEAPDDTHLFEKIVEIPLFNRCYAVIQMSVFLCFLVCRLLNRTDGYWGVWTVAFACEVYFAFNWFLQHNLRWLYVSYRTHLDRFDKRYAGENAMDLPCVDVIITTADIKKESAIVTMNTVLSVLALDYPTEKFACYVSDDGASPVVYYSLLETLSFAKKWVPFCRKYNLETRAPFPFFDRQKYLSSSNADLMLESNSMTEEYETLKTKISRAMQTEQIPVSKWDDGFAFKDSESSNHPSIVKIIHEHRVDTEDILPHLIYVAREKYPKVKHHYKAGAMNTMVRVSGLMTNAPYLLNLDCDMFVNNSRVICHAMCILLDSKLEPDCSFVQFPQDYYSSSTDNNPMANTFKGLNKIAKAMNGFKGAVYCGTGCFHRRKTIYGSPPDCRGFQSLWTDRDFLQKFGQSNPFLQSVINAFNEVEHYNNAALSAKVSDALELTRCSYEFNTSWGKEVGWSYVSIVEDIVTGLRIHTLGWKSVFCMPETPGFLGCPPSSIVEASIQQRRWISGLLRIAFSESSPWLGWSSSNLCIRLRMVYAYCTQQGIMGVVTICYVVVPIYSLLTQKPAMPKLKKPDFIMGAAVFLLCYGMELWECLQVGGSVQGWLQQQRMWTINCCSSWLFGVMDLILEMLEINEMVFQVTPKAFSDEIDKIQVDVKYKSPYLNVPPTTLLLVSMAAITFKSFRSISGGHHGESIMIAESVCCCWTIVCLWPFVKALVRKELPMSVVAKSTFFTLLICLSLIKVEST